MDTKKELQNIIENLTIYANERRNLPIPQLILRTYTNKLKEIATELS